MEQLWMAYEYLCISLTARIRVAPAPYDLIRII